MTPEEPRESVGLYGTKYAATEDIKPKQPEQPPKLAAASDVAFNVLKRFDAFSSGNDVEKLRRILSTGSDLVGHVLCSTRMIGRRSDTPEQPRDPELIVELARLSILLTQSLDQLLLNLPVNDPTIEALRKMAEREPTWPTLVRPGDEKFTKVKLAKLGVGNKALGRVNAKRSPSLATARNRLTQQLCRRIEWGARGIANRTPRQVYLYLMLQPDIPEIQHERLLKILRTFKPLSKETLTWWNRALTDYVLIIGLERFPELETVRSADGPKFVKGQEAKLRSQLQKFFHPALKNLLS
jgi:hypothetical protein